MRLLPAREKKVKKKRQGKNSLPKTVENLSLTKDYEQQWWLLKENIVSIDAQALSGTRSQALMWDSHSQRIGTYHLHIGTAVANNMIRVWRVESRRL